MRGVLAMSALTTTGTCYVFEDESCYVKYLYCEHNNFISNYNYEIYKYIKLYQQLYIVIENNTYT